ncbi:MAG: Eco57I restriction-modification methylase domain-containing protein [Prevotella sp.]|nr:Eco57I restriction-modification methylase domain-containing protein [Prevotella sp.]
MNEENFYNLLANHKFEDLFIDELCWNNPKGQRSLPQYEIEGKTLDITVIAQRNGFQILTCQVNDIPTHSLCKQLDSKLRNQAYYYILIFTHKDSDYQCWVSPVAQQGKREMVMIEYTNKEQTDFLFSKLQSITFTYNDVTTIVDVVERVNHAFAINSERITRDFYAGFNKEHKAFAAFISGINVDTDRKWYASVMLNRLMFCYFVQKKGFLDGDTEYLSNKLKEVRSTEGENQFYRSFYRDFLLSLFHDGLNSPRHNPDWEKRFGRIPYLNGGLFDFHYLEQQYSDIDIADSAFESLFAFFDKWQWHLDTRITATGKDINPDVLGYIFEQYINDRAAMGAYYTKEDITEYISKNCILPYLFDRVADSSSRDDFKSNGYVWKTLKDSGDKYIYNAVKKGYSADWQQLIPDNIAQGLDTSTPNLLERRAYWNTPTPEKFALPTEIWRETIERFQRCDDLLHKISNGEITQINDFITYNLDIRQFAEDLLINATDHRFVANFYQALQKITILDPTCGSGAFLFAAMNILEPLYDYCIQRMEEFHEKNDKLFKSELNEIKSKYRSNIQYFIYKSIILRNLYGVDIMAEATEIAKLRLFLKMVAVVEVNKYADNLGLDPLPDIDFNIRCGNTLVGYATQHELNQSLVGGDMYANSEFREKVENEMDVVAKAYSAFKTIQMTQNDDITAFKNAKSQLRERLSSLNSTLNKYMYGKGTGMSYEQWLSSYQPFHWLAEFYEIIKGNGGFDVIIGNPPYVEYSNVRNEYQIKNYDCIDSGNLYAFVIEKSLNISHISSRNGMIIQMSAFCTPRMESFQKVWFEHAKFSSLAFFDDRPGKLFENLQHIRVVIPILEVGTPSDYVATTGYNKFYSSHRKYLFQTLTYYKSNIVRKKFSVMKIHTKIEESIAIKLWANKSSIQNYESLTKNDNYVYYGSGFGYFGKILNYKSFFYGEKITKSTGDKYYFILKDYNRDVFVGILNSSLFYWFYINYSDGHNFTKTIIRAMPFKYEKSDNLIHLVKCLMDDMTKKKGRKICNYKSTGHIEYDEYYPKLSKKLINEIDKELAKHYGFTDEELDFIINYDIKYRMGDELNGE